MHQNIDAAAFLSKVHRDVQTVGVVRLFVKRSGMRCATFYRHEYR